MTRPADLAAIIATPINSHPAVLGMGLRAQLGYMQHCRATDRWPDDDGLQAAVNHGFDLAKRVEALPNTPDNLRLRALAIGVTADSTDNLANLDLGELAAHANGTVGRLVRQVLTCVMAMPIAPTVPPPPAELLALFAAHQNLKAAVDVIDDRHTRLRAACLAEVEKLPHTEATYQGVGGPVTLSTESRANVGSAYNFVVMSRTKDAPRFKKRPADYIAASRRIVAADKWRGRKIRRIMARSNALLELSNATYEAAGDIRAEIENHPVATVADLIVKLEWLTEHSDFGEGLHDAHILASLKQLAGVVA